MNYRKRIQGISGTSSIAVNVVKRLGLAFTQNLWAFPVLLLLSIVPAAHAQLDQGAITGLVTDSSGATVADAQVFLKSVDSGLVLQTKSDGHGDYTFSPVKIGNYEISVQAAGFSKTTQENLHLDLQQRLNVPITLHPGAVSDTISVTTAPPLLQTEQSSVGQVLTPTTINDTPLNGRNWVYIAQLTAGVTPGANGSRGNGQGDFSANGQPSEQNNFILDGVDNNINVLDFLNGASFVVRPPPDALAEFKLETSNFSAEYGHSSGAVINASVKSGTNEVHGALWEYFRNNGLNARDLNATVAPPKYRQNQFGATLGLPIIKNKVFFFGDLEANRIVDAITDSPYTVPTPLMRQGNFSELLNTSLTGGSVPIRLYEPNNGSTPLTCGTSQNTFCSNQIDLTAQSLLNLFPQPNANNGATFNNYVVSRTEVDNTFQWDTRADWNISAKDQAFARFSYSHEVTAFPPPLGSVLDGGANFNTDGNWSNRGENFVLSETHIFSPKWVNEFRFGYNYGRFSRLEVNAGNNLAPGLGLGGVPFGAGNNTGGLPLITVGSTVFGTPPFLPSVEGENVYQILDNLTTTLGKHSLKFGVSFQSIRFLTLQVQAPMGAYTYTAHTTSSGAATNTGYAMADFLANSMNSAVITPLSAFNDARWYRSAYVEDDWKLLPSLTLNLGVRYDYYQPLRETGGLQDNFVPTGPLGVGTGSAVLQIPSQSRGVSLGTTFPALLAANNVSIQYLDNSALATTQNKNFAPRIGFAYTAPSRTVIRSGFGIFFGALENKGNSIAQNFPFQLKSNYTAPSCAGLNCAGDGLTLETGLSTQLAAGLQNSVNLPTLFGQENNPKTPYTMEENFTVEQSITNNLAFSLGYVGVMGRHLQITPLINSAEGIAKTGVNVQTLVPFPGIATRLLYTTTVGVSSYNGMLAKLEKRASHGLSFLATYTWSHSLDNAPQILESGGGYGDSNLVPNSFEYTNSLQDVRNRVTLNGTYRLPFGSHQKFRSSHGIVNGIIGDWMTSLTFVAESGPPFTVSPANVSAPSGIPTQHAILVGDPFRAGGSPDPSNPTITCATKTRTLQHWYNPCAFANPLNGTGIATGTILTDAAHAIAYTGGKRNTVPGPGYTRVNMSLFKDVPTYREQKLEARVDIFNVLNTPSYGIPSTATDNTAGGLITTPRFFQNFTPDARFFQLSLKYIF